MIRSKCCHGESKERNDINDIIINDLTRPIITVSTDTCLTQFEASVEVLQLEFY